jgi:hypothetical protein
MIVVVHCCDPWEGYLRYLEEQCEVEWREHELELDLKREAELNPPVEEADIEVIDLALAADLNLVTNDVEEAPPAYAE